MISTIGYQKIATCDPVLIVANNGCKTNSNKNLLLLPTNKNDSNNRFANKSNSLVNYDSSKVVQNNNNKQDRQKINKG